MLKQVHPGPGVARGNDYTLFALSAGIVTFKKNKYIKQVIGVVPVCPVLLAQCMQVHLSAWHAAVQADSDCIL